MVYDLDPELASALSGIPDAETIEVLRCGLVQPLKIKSL